jgi:hypothetical protein
MVVAVKGLFQLIKRSPDCMLPAAMGFAFPEQTRENCLSRFSADDSCRVHLARLELC